MKSLQFRYMAILGNTSSCLVTVIYAKTEKHLAKFLDNKTAVFRSNVCSATKNQTH